MSNNTWELADLPPGSKPIGCKWIFKKKLNPDGSIDKFKARLVAKGYRQKEGVDFFDTYSPVARLTSIRVLIAIASIHNLIVHQMDVRTAFLNGELEEEIYMDQPEGLIVQGMEHKVCRLRKSLYGLKQAPKQWNEKFDQILTSNGYMINESDKCIYSRFNELSGVIICVYVDDMLIFGTDMEVVRRTKKFLSDHFDMKDLGVADVILGIKIIRNPEGITLSQSHYVEKVLRKFEQFDCSPAKTPFDSSVQLRKNQGPSVSALEYSRVIGSLMYLMNCTRPDIAYAVGRLSRYLMNPGKEHWEALIRLMRYLKYTLSYGIHFSRYPAVLEGYCDAN